MAQFFKVLLRGIIVTVLLPVIVLVLVLYGVYCLFTFIFMFIKSTILFFMGDSINDELKEDVESKRIILEQEQAKANQRDLVNNMNSVFGAMAQQMQQYTQQMQNPAQPIQQNQPEPIEYQDIPSIGSEENKEGVNDNDQSN